MAWVHAVLLTLLVVASGAWGAATLQASTAGVVVHFEANITTEISPPFIKELPIKGALNSQCPSECSCEKTSYTCSLHSGEVQIKEDEHVIGFICTKGMLRPSEVPLRGKSYGAWVPNSTLDKVVVKGCALAEEPLLLALQRRGFKDAPTLSLVAPKTPLSALHVQGLTLQHLEIMHTEWEEWELPLAAFEALPSLRTLQLGGRGLMALPPRPFRRLHNLPTLILLGNRFLRLSNDTFQGLEMLKELSLKVYQHSRLPEDLLGPTRLLRMIVHSSNQFISLPGTLLAGLDHVDRMLLIENQADLTLDAGVFANLRSLRKLHLSGSRLSSLPSDAFSGCSALETLTLTANSLHSLQAGLLEDLMSLKELDLSHNGLNTIPPDFLANQHKLLSLKLDNNNLETLPSSMFRGLHQLKNLDLSHNKLLSLGEDPSQKGKYEPMFGSYSPFYKLKQLTNVDLSHNHMRVIPEHGDTELFSLQYLDLSFNDISYIDNESIMFTKVWIKEMTVDLRHNKISTVNLTDEVKGNAIVLIENNPFTCDCLTPAFQTALRQTKRTPRFVGEKFTCAAPPELQSTKLLDATLEQLTCKVLPPLCPSLCRCLRSVVLLHLDCASLPPTLPSPGNFRLSITYLRLRSINTSFLDLPRHVTKLDLSGLNLTRVPQLPPDIEIDFSNNHLDKVPIHLFKNNNNTVRLAQNPIACDCSHEDDVTALLEIGSDIVLDYNDLACSDSTPVRSKLRVNLCAKLDSTIYGSTIVVILLVLTITIVLARRYRYKFLICIDQLCCCSPQGNEQANHNKDVFLSYAHPDQEYAVKLLNHLEEPPHCFKVCIHERDWVVGEYIPTQIARSVKRSRWTVILLSTHFLTSMWGLMEFREAYLHMQKERKGRILIVLIDDVMSNDQMTEELRSYVTNTTYLNINDPLFWDRLPYALRRRRTHWWRRPPSPASPTSPAPTDMQLRTIIKTEVATDDALDKAAPS